MDIHGTLQLPQLGIIKANGTDAAQFLNSQLSADILNIARNKAQFAAYCSPQGRVLASFIVLQNTPEEFWLICSEDILEVTLKRLKMFVLRSKVELSIAADLEIQGHASSTQTLQGIEPWGVRKEEDTTFIELLPVQNIQRRLIIQDKNGLLSQPTPLPMAVWQWLHMRSGLLMVNAATRDQFIPQMLNYESLGAINFNKGCYPGQEVVARSQFRGSVK
ncbi:MAG: YgfZ/GcvT domain-containing protein, partial [Saezia sp.]